MVTFLCSSPTRELDREHPCPMLDERNGFVEQVKRFWREDARCLMIAAWPAAHGLNDEMTAYYREAAEYSGLPVGCFDLWDDRLPPLSREGLHRYDVLFLAGGHVPSEFRWFEEIGLPRLLKGYEGLVIGTSAGSMNAAELVYAWPEEPGETNLPEEELFYPGLGLARTLVLPHYQKLKNATLDGFLLLEDIARGHSRGRAFYAIPDGSYVLVEGGRETLFGEAHLVKNGRITPFAREGEVHLLHGGKTPFDL